MLDNDQLMIQDVKEHTVSVVFQSHIVAFQSSGTLILTRPVRLDLWMDLWMDLWSPMSVHVWDMGP